MSDIFRQFTTFQPMQVVTTTTTWGGWSIENPRCFGCAHCTIRGGLSVCLCASRTVDSNGTCLSYVRGDAE